MARGKGRPVRLDWRGGGPRGRGAAAPGRLIEGDNLPVMAALLPELEGRIDLVYIDPPFHSGKSFSARIGAGEDSRKPNTWATETAYDDRWPDLAAYLDML